VIKPQEKKRQNITILCNGTTEETGKAGIGGKTGKREVSMEFILNLENASRDLL
jgi:hypothetical protein